MKYYFELTIKQVGKVTVPEKMNALISDMHYSIVSHANNKNEKNKLAMAFPHYGENLGNLLRIHGTLSDVQFALNSVKSTHKGVNVSEIKEVPETALYRCYSRKRPTKQNSKLQAGIKSGHITDVKKYRKKMFAEIIDLPFANVHSSSTKQDYKIFIKMTEHDAANIGEINSYGLSNVQTVPHF